MAPKCTSSTSKTSSSTRASRQVPRERIANDAVTGKLTSDDQRAATAPRSCALDVISSGTLVGRGWVAEGGCGHT
jgi:hypothetical protein